MKERPILFNGAMVRALLDGTKTMTRRVIKPQPRVGAAAVECLTCHRFKGPRGRSVPSEAANGYCDWDCDGYSQDPQSDHLHPGESLGDFGYPSDWMGQCHYGVPGDRLRLCLNVLGLPPIYFGDGEVSKVRVERVQEISEEDARAEGCIPDLCEHPGTVIPGACEHCMNTGDAWPAVQQFESLWDSINGKRPGCSWSDNPWCWVVSFRRLP